MNGKSPWKYVPPAGPVLSLLLTGLVLLSALIYYRAVKIQRFLEPALALSQPRNEFSKNITRIFQKEFGPKSVKGLTLKSSSILMEKSLLISREGTLNASAQADLRQLARVFLALMKDDHARSEISLVLIIGRFPSHGASGTNVAEWAKAGRMVGLRTGAAGAPRISARAVPLRRCALCARGSSPPRSVRSSAAAHCGSMLRVGSGPARSQPCWTIWTLNCWRPTTSSGTRSPRSSPRASKRSTTPPSLRHIIS